jgi:GT2 family glycosyltransferase
MKSNDNSIDVSIIIVSWNVKELLLESIKSIKQHTNDINYEIIVIDNNSSDDSVNAIKNEYPDIRLIENKQNKGFGVANNQGVKVARGK